MALRHQAQTRLGPDTDLNCGICRLCPSAPVALAGTQLPRASGDSGNSNFRMAGLEGVCVASGSGAGTSRYETLVGGALELLQETTLNGIGGEGALQRVCAAEDLLLLNLHLLRFLADLATHPVTPHSPVPPDPSAINFCAASQAPTTSQSPGRTIASNLPRTRVCCIFSRPAPPPPPKLDSCFRKISRRVAPTQRPGPLWSVQRDAIAQIQLRQIQFNAAMPIQRPRFRENLHPDR
jgi:hypothetical protein